MEIPFVQEMMGDDALSQLFAVAILLVLALVADFVTRRLFLGLVHKFAGHTKARWDDVLVARKFFDRLAHLVPAVVLHFGLDFLAVHPPVLEALLRGINTAIVIIVLRTISAGLQALNDVYTMSPEAARRPIKGYLQIVALVVYILGAVIAVATLLDKSPIVFLTGIGALSAALLLVFRDTLLSLVASIQLTSNDMIRVGDWIEVPDQGADGDVVDIALHTVKVRNWDKTTTTIPTYTLISQGFKNWRSMGESGGRRIRRALYIDTNTIRHLTDTEVAEFARYELLQSYFASKQEELAAYNKRKGVDSSVVPEHRRLTNVGTARAYINAYLQARDDIRQDMTLLVRQMDPGPKGLPIQIYCFTNNTDWLAYEQIQSDIFDHLLATMPRFGLRVFQEPTGSDFRSLLPLAD